MTRTDHRDAPDDPPRAGIDRNDSLATLALALFGQRHGIDDLPIPTRSREVRPAFGQCNFGEVADGN